MLGHHIAHSQHPAAAGFFVPGARCVLRLAGFGCVGVGLAVLYAALELVRSAVALAGG